MRCLNGHSRMTPEEKNARRRELDRDPFHHALSLRTAKAWRERNPEKIAERNARRRAKYAANRERERARAKAWRDANKDKIKAAWKRYMSKPGNHARLLERDRKRLEVPGARERKNALRRARIANNPRYAAKLRWQKRFQYHTHKYDRIGIRAMVRQEWKDKWMSVVSEGPVRIERYLKRCGVRVRSFFTKWRRAGMPTDIEEIMQVIGFGKENP